MSVKRYSLQPRDGTEMGDDPNYSMCPSADGTFVKHSDYQSLAAENERLQSALHRIASAPILDYITDIARESLSRKAAP